MIRRWVSEITKWVSEITAVNLSVFTITSAIGGALVYLFGPWNKTFSWLLILMGADIVTGVMTALAKKSAKTEDGKFASSAGTLGLFKKIGVLICVMIAYGIGILFLPDPAQAITFRDAVMCGFAFFEVTSIFENLDRLGIKLPPVLIKFFKAIKKKVYNDEPVNSITTKEPKNEESEELEG